MRALYIHLSTLSPLAIRADHAETGVEMISYIPGSTFIGALATVHRALYSQEQEFSRFFLNEEILFSDFYLANFAVLNGLPKLPVYPLPHTAISCKREPGFRFERDKTEKKRHGVDDNLRDWAMFALSMYREKSPFTDALNNHKHCPICDESMDRFPGYYRRRKGKQIEREQAKTESRKLQTRTGINRETGTVEENILYNRMVFEEEVEFWGQVMLPDDDKLYDTFSAFLRKVNSDSLLRLGTGRTRGLGKVAMRINTLYSEDSREERFKQFQERLAKFNTHISEQAKAASLDDIQDYFFAVTLHSALILCDDFLRYKGKLDAETLNRELGRDIPELHLLYQNAGMKRVTGWNELWGTPKTNEYAIEAGSVFLFLCKSEPNGELNENLQRALFQLEEQGLGKRRAEGFGRICISDDFHSEGRQ